MPQISVDANFNCKYTTDCSGCKRLDKKNYEFSDVTKLSLSLEAVASNLKKARKKWGKSQELAANAVEVSTRMWQRYEKAELLPPLDVLAKFAELSGTPIAELISSVAPEPLKQSEVPIERIPVVNRIPASGFIESYDDGIIEDWIATSRLEHRGLFALRVRGNSMSPRIEDGDIVILAPQIEFVNNKIYAVVTTNSEHTLKQVRRVDETYFLIPLNPAYETLMVRANEIVHLIRVVQILKDV